MPVPETALGVWLNRRYVGALRRRGARYAFRLHPSYAGDPSRAVLGLSFEQDLSRVHAGDRRLPAWFANLLPEGPMRRWIAQQAGVPGSDAFGMLAEIGHDLPGAVSVLPLPLDAVTAGTDDAPEQGHAADTARSETPGDGRGRFSLAGVQMKMSMIAAGDRLVVPLGGDVGDWIVKFPDVQFPALPQVEAFTMTLARRCGMRVPETRLVHRDQLPDTPDNLWRGSEDVAYAIRRFDRRPGGGRVHMEDMAQVAGAFPEDKYEGAAESVAIYAYRGADVESLLEVVRRLAFNVMVDNADAHLKNWSLLYENPRRPVLSPAYDLVSLAPYPTFGGVLALPLLGNSRADHVVLSDFEELGRRLGLGDPTLLRAAAASTRAAVLDHWSEVAEEVLGGRPGDVALIGAIITARAATLV